MVKGEWIPDRCLEDPSNHYCENYYSGHFIVVPLLPTSMHRTASEVHVVRQAWQPHMAGQIHGFFW
jgi:hypothetical protein